MDYHYLIPLTMEITMEKLRWILLLLVLVIMVVVSISPKLVVVNILDEPVKSSYILQYVDDIITKAHYRSEFIARPAVLAPKEVLNGVYDVEPFRVGSFTYLYPDLVQIPEPLAKLDLVIYTTHPLQSLNEVDVLGVQYGYPIIAKIGESFSNNTNFFTRFEQGIKALHYGLIDGYLAPVAPYYHAAQNLSPELASSLYSYTLTDEDIQNTSVPWDPYLYMYISPQLPEEVVDRLTNAVRIVRPLWVDVNNNELK